jgi:hypothetical protein
MYSETTGGVPPQMSNRVSPARPLRADITISGTLAASPYLGPATGAQEAALEALMNTDLLTDEPVVRPGRTAGGTITVFIPAHNEQASIGATLGSLRDQTKLPTQVIVVCDN